MTTITTIELTKQSDEVTISPSDGDITVTASSTKGNDSVTLDGYTIADGKDLSDYFVWSNDGKNLILSYYANGVDTDEATPTQTITFVNYFTSSSAASTKFNITVYCGNESYALTDLIQNEVDGTGKNGTTFTGTVFTDIITGTDYADKITTGKGNDYITSGAGNDKITINGAGDKTLYFDSSSGDDTISGISKSTSVNLEFEAAEDQTYSLEYSKSGNDLIVECTYVTGDDSDTAETTFTTIKDFFKSESNAEKLLINGETFDASVIVEGKGTLKGSFTDDEFYGSGKNDKMYGYGGDNIYYMWDDYDGSYFFGKDTIYATGDSDTVVFVDGTTLSYKVSGNDVIITATSDGTVEDTSADTDDATIAEGTVLGTVTLKNALANIDNIKVQIGLGEDENGNEITATSLQELMEALGVLTYGDEAAETAQTLKGTGFDETFIGGSGNDKITTGAGDDVITAGEGNDTITISGAGDKTINIANGDGNDTISGISKSTSVNLVFSKNEYEDDVQLSEMVTKTDEDTNTTSYTKTSTKTVTSESDAELSYSKSGNNLIITKTYTVTTTVSTATVAYDSADSTEGTTGEYTEDNSNTKTVTETITIKDFFKSASNADKLTINGVTFGSEDFDALLLISGKGTIKGTSYNDYITGSSSKDKITTGAGDDTIDAGAGNDTITVNGSGEKTINIGKGDGNDTIVISDTSAAVKLVYANDVVTSDEGTATTYTPSLSYSKSGNNLIITSTYTDSDGVETTSTTTIKNYFKSESVADALSVYVNGTVQTIDTIHISGKGTITGTDLDDIITGSSSKDKITTGDGDDIIDSGAGSDTITVNGTGTKTIKIANTDGNDTVVVNESESNVNIVFTGSETSTTTDTVTTYDDAPELTYTKSGTSLVITRTYTNAKGKEVTATTTIKNYFDSEGNVLYDNLTINGTSIADAITAGGGLVITGSTKKSNTLYGTDYDDVITGGSKADTIYAGSGNDTVYAGAGNDVIYAESGDNTFYKTSGDAEIYAGEGDDTYNVSTLTNGYVEISDEGGSDTLNIENVDLDNLKLFFDVAKSDASSSTEVDGSLVITEDNIGLTYENGVSIDNYSSDGAIESIYINGVDYTAQIGELADQITEEVQALLAKDDYSGYDTVLEVLNSDSASDTLKSDLLAIYENADGSNTYSFTTSAQTDETTGETSYTAQSVTDYIGDSDVYNVDSSFDLSNESLTITDEYGDNDVLNIAQSADDLTVLFDITSDGTVGDALYVIDDEATSLDTGIALSGVDTVYTLETSTEEDGTASSVYTEYSSPTAEVIVSVQNWLSTNGYDSVSSVLADENASSETIASLIAAYTPTTSDATTVG